MGNEFKVMEMNVLGEVQRALAEVILSYFDKWKWRCHVVPAPPRVKRRQWCLSRQRMNSSVLAGIVMVIVVQQHTLALLAPAQCKSSCVTACLTHLTVLVGERIDFFFFFLRAKTKPLLSCWAALMLFRPNSCPSRGHLQATSGQAHGYLTTSLSWTFVFSYDWHSFFGMCTNPFLLNCSRWQFQIDLAAMLQEGGSRHWRQRGGRDLENNGKVGRRTENEPEWDFCSWVKKRLWIYLNHGLDLPPAHFLFAAWQLSTVLGLQPLPVLIRVPLKLNLRLSILGMPLPCPPSARSNKILKPFQFSFCVFFSTCSSVSHIRKQTRSQSQALILFLLFSPLLTSDSSSQYHESME